MGSVTDIHDYEQGKLLLNDIEDEFYRKMDYGEKPERLVIDAKSFNKLSEALKRKDIYKYTDNFKVNLYKLYFTYGMETVETEVVVVDISKEFFYVTESSKKEFKKFVKNKLQN